MNQDNSNIDPQLLLQIAGGDHHAFKTFFDKMVPVLRPGVIKLVQSEDVFNEIMQECFLRVWLKRDQLPTIEQPQNWLYRIAANLCFTWLNRQAKRYNRLTDLADVLQDNQPDDSVSRPDQQLDFKSARQLIREAIMLLPERKKTIYIMSRNEGLKSSEIANRLGVSDSYVRNTISEALRFIRDHLAKAGHILSILLF